MTAHSEAPLSDIEIASLKRTARERVQKFRSESAPEDGMYAAEALHSLGMAHLGNGDLDEAADALDCAATVYRQVDLTGPSTTSAHINLVGIHAVVLAATERDDDALNECEAGLQMLTTLGEGPTGPYAQVVYDLHSTRWPLLAEDDETAGESAMVAVDAARHLLSEEAVSPVVLASAICDAVMLEADTSDIGGNTALLREAFDALTAQPDVTADGWCSTLEDVTFDLLEAQADDSMDGFDDVDELEHFDELDDLDDDADELDSEPAGQAPEFYVVKDGTAHAEIDSQDHTVTIKDVSLTNIGTNRTGNSTSTDVNNMDLDGTDLEDSDLEDPDFDDADLGDTDLDNLTSEEIRAFLEDELDGLDDDFLDEDGDEDDALMSPNAEQLATAQQVSDIFEAQTPHQDRTINEVAVFWHLTATKMLSRADDWDNANTHLLRACALGTEHLPQHPSPAAPGATHLFVPVCQFIRNSHLAERQDLSAKWLDEAQRLATKVEHGTLSEINSLMDLSEHLQAAERLGEALEVASQAAGFARAKYDEDDAQSAFVFQETLQRVIAVKSQMMQPTLGTTESAELKSVSDRIEEMLEELAD